MTAPLGLTAAERAVLKHLVRDGAIAETGVERFRSNARSEGAILRGISPDLDGQDVDAAIAAIRALRAALSP